MKLGAIFVLAVGLAMDATAVAAARGLATPRIHVRHMLLVGGIFGGFQALMPLLGWFLGAQIGPWIRAWDHWLVFVLLGALGLRMLREARAAQTSSSGQSGNVVAAAESANAFGLRLMLGLAIATSIDAFAAGITLPLMGAPLVVSLTAIGVTTALLSVLGLLAGRRFGAALGPRLDIAGGWMLIALGTKTLIEHLLSD